MAPQFKKTEEAEASDGQHGLEVIFAPTRKNLREWHNLAPIIPSSSSSIWPHAQYFIFLPLMGHDGV